MKNTKHYEILKTPYKVIGDVIFYLYDNEHHYFDFEPKNKMTTKLNGKNSWFFSMLSNEFNSKIDLLENNHTISLSDTLIKNEVITSTLNSDKMNISYTLFYTGIALILILGGSTVYLIYTSKKDKENSSVV